jgi:hypothetical protein
MHLAATTCRLVPARGRLQVAAWRLERQYAIAWSVLIGAVKLESRQSETLSVKELHALDHPYRALTKRRYNGVTVAQNRAAFLKEKP